MTAEVIDEFEVTEESEVSVVSVVSEVNEVWAWGIWADKEEFEESEVTEVNEVWAWDLLAVIASIVFYVICKSKVRDRLTEVSVVKE